MGTQLEKLTPQEIAIRDALLARESRMEQLMTATTKSRGLTPRRVMRQMWHAMQENQKLKMCSAASLAECCEQAIEYGMAIGGPLAEAYVVPFKTKARFQIGFRGYTRLLIETGTVRALTVEFVYEGDTFQRHLGIGGEFIHIANPAADRESRPITHVYSEFLMKDDSKTRFVMTKQEIDDHARRHSQSFDDPRGPWKTAWKAMASKTVLKQPVNRGILPLVFTAGPADLDEIPPATPFDDGSGNADEIELRPLNVERLASDLALAKNFDEVGQVRDHYLGCVLSDDEPKVLQQCMDRMQVLDVAQVDAQAAAAEKKEHEAVSKK